ncbi:MAG: LLM class flavin-dependent oxidoreductase [Demequina sp.]|uniref:LLM class flavin-dependent oxidoreductase n=1 Tax=Demequina sp. TaxID=2050685 RepID=UPI003A886C86
MTAFDTAIPATASPEVEFVSQLHVNRSTELEPRETPAIELDFVRRYARAVEDAGFDYTLLPYGSTSADSFVLASAVAQLTSRLKTIVALRPNTVHPLVAAQQLATLDHLSEGRAVVHLISGGSDEEQARHGDYLTKDERYDRTAEYIDLLRRAWTERTAFSHRGTHYRFDGFGPGLATYDGDALTVSIGGQSPAAVKVGGERADIFSFWGEPLAAFESEVARVDAVAAAAGRSTRPRYWVTFRPIIAATEELAWEKARDYVARVGETFAAGGHRGQGAHRPSAAPQNVGSQRALAFASEAEVHDRALWTATAAATHGSGAATALVGTPETVAAAILDYIDRGASIVSIRGYDTLNDVIDYGRHVLPLVREELAHRASTGQRGPLQREHLGALAGTALASVS